MTKSAKKVLKAEELHPAICGAPDWFNSRPITYASSHANDLTPLIPNHLIAGELGGQFAPEALEKDEVITPRKRIQQLSTRFWRRWRNQINKRNQAD